LEESYSDLIKDDGFIRSPFRPGMSATVDIQTETALNILTIPIQAVTTRADTAKTNTDEAPIEEGEEAAESDTKKEDLVEVVFVFEEGKAKMVKVSTGIQDNMFIEITEGIEVDQDIITGPYRAVSKKLKDGDLVKKVDKKDLFKED